MSRPHRIVFWIALTLPLVGEGRAYGITIRFSRQAVVASPYVTLGDVAEISDGPSKELANLQNARLAPSPPGREPIYLDFDTIKSRLHALGQNLSEVSFSGPSRIEVRRQDEPSPAAPPQPASRLPESGPSRAQSAKAENIAETAIRRALTHSNPDLDGAGLKIDIRLSSEGVPRLLSRGVSSWRVTGWQGRLNEPQTLVLVPEPTTIGVPNVPVMCLIELPPQVLTPTRTIPVGHVIRPSDVTWMRSRTGDGATRVEAVVGMEAKVAIRPGAPIEAADLRKKPFVRARDIVAVYARQGGVTVKRTMRALKTGGLGDTIPLMSLSGNERFEARVTGYHETEVIDSISP